MTRLKKQDRLGVSIYVCLVCLLLAMQIKFGESNGD